MSEHSTHKTASVEIHLAADACYPAARVTLEVLATPGKPPRVAAGYLQIADAPDEVTASRQFDEGVLVADFGPGREFVGLELLAPRAAETLPDLRGYSGRHGKLIVAAYLTLWSLWQQVTLGLATATAGRLGAIGRRAAPRPWLAPVPA